MKNGYELCYRTEGTLEEVMAAAPGKLLSIDEVVRSLNECAFVIETVANLRGMEETMLPTSDKARAIAKLLEGTQQT